MHDCNEWRMPPTSSVMPLLLALVNPVGHFAAWEQPKLFSEEVRAGLRPLRSTFLNGARAA